MPLVPCESCRRHLRASETQCPFCRERRTRSALAVIAVGSALALAGCDQVMPGAKYGGPPPGYVPPPPADTSDAAMTPSTSASTVTSPRLTGDAGNMNQVIAPAAKYGGPPRNGPQSF